MALDIDVFDPDIFVQGVPHDRFKILRREAPVYFHPEPGGPGYYAITKYEDVVTISKNPKIYSSAKGGTNIQNSDEAQLMKLRMLMLNMDPPQHNKFRRLVHRGFTPRMVERMEAYARIAAKQIVDDIAKKGTCDFVSEVAAALPLTIIADLMGIPHDERHIIYDLSNKLIGFDDPEFQNTAADAEQASMQMWMYANKIAADRKGKDGEDLVSVLINGEVDGQKLTEMEFDSFFLLLAVAGNETTRNLISGGMLALIEHPDQRARLLADPSLIDTAVEEMLRWVTPVMYFRRTVTCDTELRGHTLKAGDKVVMYYPSANRDEEVFENADTFDVGRTPNEHLAFGIGQHSCLGLSLARLEIRIVFQELLARLPDIELAGPPRRLRSNFINGVKEIPARFTPES